MFRCTAVALSPVLAPAKLAAAVLARLYQDISRYLNTPEAKDKLFNAGIEVE